MAVKAPPAPPPASAYSWTGFYIGANGGYAWGKSDVSTTVNSVGNYSRSITTQYISAPGTFFTINQSIKTDWLFTARPRIGWASNNWLLYVTGGLAVTEIKYNNTFTDTFGGAFENGSISKTKAGWVVGGGVEYGLTRNWSVKAEYLYMDFGNVSSTGAMSAFGGLSFASLNHSADLKANVVRAGINYRFY